MSANDKPFDLKMLLMIIAVQALLFYGFYCREIAWSPPLYSDQAQILTETYRLQEHILTHGFRELWKALWTGGNPTGMALPIEGALSGLILGGVRFPQLCLNFVTFATLQVAAFYTARAVWASRVYAYAVLGLILCQNTPWFWAGGLFDFRLDFLAYCVFGIWACAVIRSKLFLDRRWAIWCGLIAAFLVLNRFLTIVYLLGIGGGLAIICLAIRFLRRADGDLVQSMGRRLCNLFLSFAVTTVVVLPILILNRAAIYGYYVIRHAVNGEKYVRAREEGIFDLPGHLFFYPRSIFRDHWGSTFLLASALMIVGGLMTRALRGSKTISSGITIRADETVPLQIVFLLGAILGPIIVLTADIAKSPVVGGIVGVPAALLVVTLTAGLTSKFIESGSTRSGKLVVACSTVVFVLGLFYQFDRASRHLPQYSQRRDLKRVAELGRWLVNYASEQDWHHPKISFDLISDWLNAETITTSGYEQLGKFIEFRTMFGNDIMGLEAPEALSLLEKSDFLLLTDAPKTGPYPFYEHLAQYWNDLKRWADNEMFVAQKVPLESYTITAYARPTATISGLSGSWVTSDGLSVEAPHAALLRYPTIRLRGSANYEWLPKSPSVSAVIDTESGALAVPASLHRLDKDYEILIDTSTSELPPDNRVRIHLKFDTFFVPKKVGINDDVRELVVPAPTQVQLIRTTL
jgi:hypothetical protein